MRNPRVFVCALPTVVVAITCQDVWGQPQQWCGNGNWYEVVVTPNISWSSARVAAESRGGHLASIASAEENAFVANLAATTPDAVFLFNGVSTRWIGPWIGGYQPSGSPEPAGGWRWVTPEPWAFTNWATDGQPDNTGNAEHFLHFSNTGPTFNGTWNDRKNDDGNRDPGYVVEYESAILSTSPDVQLCPTNSLELRIELIPGIETAIAMQWQARVASGHPWIDLVDGINSIAGIAPLVAVGTRSTALMATPTAGMWTLGHIAEFRCVVASSCRADESESISVSVCAANYNCDTSIDILDFLDFFEDFGACVSQPVPCGIHGYPDVNRDTIIDILDFLDFIDAFGQGC